MIAPNICGNELVCIFVPIVSLVVEQPAEQQEFSCSVAVIAGNRTQIFSLLKSRSMEME
jgi:hypothetical protein